MNQHSFACEASHSCIQRADHASRRRHGGVCRLAHRSQYIRAVVFGQQSVHVLQGAVDVATGVHAAFQLVQQP